MNQPCWLILNDYWVNFHEYHYWVNMLNHPCWCWFWFHHDWLDIVYDIVYDIEWYWMILNDIERYWVILNAIDWYWFLVFQLLYPVVNGFVRFGATDPQVPLSMEGFLVFEGGHNWINEMHTMNRQYQSINMIMMMMTMTMTMMMMMTMMTMMMMMMMMMLMNLWLDNGLSGPAVDWRSKRRNYGCIHFH